jgi:hypothetical protein
LGDELVGLHAHPAIEIDEFVVVEVIVEVQVMNIAREPRPERDGNLGLKELDHGICVGREATDEAPLDDAQEEAASMASDEVPNNLAIQTRNHQRKIGAEHEEKTVAEQETGFFAPPSGYHDIQKAQELVQKGQIQPWLRLRRWHLGLRVVGQAGRARGLQEEAAVGIEGGGFGGVYDDLGGRVSVRHVNGPRAILATETGVSAQQVPAGLSIGAALLPPPVSAV